MLVPNLFLVVFNHFFCISHYILTLTCSVQLKRDIGPLSCRWLLVQLTIISHWLYLHKHRVDKTRNYLQSALYIHNSYIKARFSTNISEIVGKLEEEVGSHR